MLWDTAHLADLIPQNLRFIVLLIYKVEKCKVTVFTCTSVFYPINMCCVYPEVGTAIGFLISKLNKVADGKQTKKAEVAHWQGVGDPCL